MKSIINFFRRIFQCPVCSEMKRQNEYLQKLVDHALASRGIAPVGAAAVSEDDQDPEEKELAALREKGAHIFGGN